MKDADLTQYGPAIIVNFFTSKTVICVECIDSAERELDSPPSRRKTSPAAEVCTANKHFHNNGLVCDMPAPYLNVQVRQRCHELLIE